MIQTVQGKKKAARVGVFELNLKVVMKDGTATHFRLHMLALFTKGKVGKVCNKFARVKESAHENLPDWFADLGEALAKSAMLGFSIARIALAPVPIPC